MAEIHKTTMTPGKLELLASWLPTQPWYLGAERTPELTKAGGFRLDDPHGEVGIEFMVVTDESGGQPLSYHVPLTYRGTPLDGAEQALVGTSEHGVLGRRWIYDGTYDPVLLAQLIAFLQGRVEAQAQGVSNTPDPSVARHFAGGGLSTAGGPAAVVNGPDGTDLSVEATGGDGERAGSADPLTLHVTRVLRPQGRSRPTAVAGERGYVAADWRLPGGERSRGFFVVLRGGAA